MQEARIEKKHHWGKKSWHVKIWFGYIPGLLEGNRNLQIGGQRQICKLRLKSVLVQDQNKKAKTGAESEKTSWEAQDRR